MTANRVIPPVNNLDPDGTYDSRYIRITSATNSDSVALTVDDETLQADVQFDGTGSADTAARSDHDHDTEYYSIAVVDSLFTSAAGDTHLRPLAFPMKSGLIYSPIESGLGIRGSVANAAIAANVIFMSPLYIPHPITIDKLGTYVGVAASGSAHLGLYTYDFATTTATLVVDAGAVSTASTGAKEATVDVAITDPDWYWLAILPSADISVHGALASRGLSFVNTGTFGASLLVAHAYGDLPATFTPSSTNSSVIAPYIGVA